MVAFNTEELIILAKCLQHTHLHQSDPGAREATAKELRHTPFLSEDAIRVIAHINAALYRMSDAEFAELKLR